MIVEVSGTVRDLPHKRIQLQDAGMQFVARRLLRGMSSRIRRRVLEHSFSLSRRFNSASVHGSAARCAFSFIFCASSASRAALRTLRLEPCSPPRASWLSFLRGLRNDRRFIAFSRFFDQGRYSF